MFISSFGAARQKAFSPLSRAIQPRSHTGTALIGSRAMPFGVQRLQGLDAFTVLVASANPVAEGFITKLTEWGVPAPNIQRAESLDRAKEKSKQAKFDLILVDYTLRHGNEEAGAKFLQFLQNKAGFPPQQIIDISNGGKMQPAQWTGMTYSQNVQWIGDDIRDFDEINGPSSTDKLFDYLTERLKR